MENRCPTCVLCSEIPRVTMKGAAHEMAPCWFHTWIPGSQDNRPCRAQQACLAGIQSPMGSSPPDLAGNIPYTTNHRDYGAQSFSPRPTFSLTGGESPLSQGARVLVLAYLSIFIKIYIHYHVLDDKNLI